MACTSEPISGLHHPLDKSWEYHQKKVVEEHAIANILEKTLLGAWKTCSGTQKSVGWLAQKQWKAEKPAETSISEYEELDLK